MITMKRLFLIAAVAVVVASCGNPRPKKTAAVETETENVEVVSVMAVQIFTLDELLAVAEENVNKTVAVRGYVTHTCKHSGKRCFIVGETPNASMRIEAKGEIGGFNRELIGSELMITGTLRERLLTKEYLAQYEKDLNEKKLKEDGSAESCQSELKNIEEMRKWMKANDKDYYSIYYMDGENYEIIE